MALVFQELIQTLGGEPEKGLTCRERAREPELPCGAAGSGGAETIPSRREEITGSYLCVWVGEWVQGRDVSQESQASPMESIPKISQCTHVHNLVFLPQIYHLFRSMTQSHSGDGADMEQLDCS